MNFPVSKLRGSAKNGKPILKGGRNSMRLKNRMHVSRRAGVSPAIFLITARSKSPAPLASGQARPWRCDTTCGPITKEARQIANYFAKIHVARMEPVPLRKLYTPGNRLDNPK
jgi:hypothetical protein